MIAAPMHRLLKVEPGEGAALWWSCAYFFCLLCSYYIMRPVRDAFGVESGMESIKWLYLATGAAMLIGSVIFAALAARYRRGRFIPWVYRFFMGNLIVFLVFFNVTPQAQQVNVGRVFYVWVSIFNLFVVSVFWSFMADLFTNAQGRRLFAVIAVGGTLGQICGSFAAGRLAGLVGSSSMLVIAILLLEAACWCVWVLNRLARAPVAGAPGAAPGGGEAPIGGGALAGLARVVRSPYLFGIALFVLCYTISSTFLYFTKLGVAAHHSSGRAAHVAFFANIDMWTGVITVLAQLVLTSRLIARFGIGVTLGLLPAVTLIGFAVMGASLADPRWLAPAAALVAFEALRRASNFAISRPAREVLYTVVARQDKYKTKNVIDTFVYRTGDQLGAWMHAGLLGLHWTAAAICFAVVPLAAAWLAIALALGRRQRAIAQGGKA